MWREGWENNTAGVWKRLFQFCVWLAVLVGLTACDAKSPLSATAGIPQAVDVLTYVIGEPSTWPRTGSQFQAQLVDAGARSICWVKYGDPDMFECWRWDDDWIYFTVDHAVDGNTGESYTFSDGRWLPRRFSGEWSFDVSDNRIRWFDRTCVSTEHGERAGMRSTGLFPYSLRARVVPAYDAGPLGVRDVLVFEYGPHLPGRAASAVERFYFAQGAGWYRWESGRGTSTFDTVGGPAMTWRRPGCLELH
jgi:hypothetical protein